ncbi:MAG: hypothetical protein ACPGPF_03800 [Pontibacterium sp.]
MSRKIKRTKRAPTPLKRFYLPSGVQPDAIAWTVTDIFGQQSYTYAEVADGIVRNRAAISQMAIFDSDLRDALVTMEFLTPQQAASLAKTKKRVICQALDWQGKP